MPKVSVIIPVHNREKFIKETIESVLNQTYSDWELIITDDGSTDKSVEVIKSFKDKRIKLFVFKRNRGSSAAYNNCLKNSKGKYIAVLDSDDVFLKTKLEKQFNFLEKNPKYKAVFSFANLIDQDSKPVLPNFYSPRKINYSNRFELLKIFCYSNNEFIHSTAFINREVFHTTGLYDLRMRQMPDFLLWIRMLLHYEAFILPEILLSYRLHSNKISTTKQNNTINRDLFEFQYTITEFLNIDKLETFIKIFPDCENKKWFTKNIELFPIVKALYIIETTHPNRQLDRIYNLTALKYLFEHFSNEHIEEIATKEMNFNFISLIDLIGANDLFNEQYDEKSQNYDRFKSSRYFKSMTSIYNKLVDIKVFKSDKF